MNKRILTVLMFGAVCFAGDKWVAATGGSDTASGDDAAHPYATITKGIDTVSDGGTVYLLAGTHTADSYVQFDATQTGKTITVEGVSAATTIIQGSSATACLYFPDTCTTGTFKFKNLSIISTTTAANGLIRCHGGASQTYTLAFDGCVIGDGTAGQNAIKFLDAAAGRSLDVNSTTINVASYLFTTAAGGGAANITFSDCNMTSPLNVDLIVLNGVISGRLTIEGSTIHATGDNGSAVSVIEGDVITGTSGDVVIRDCLFDVQGDYKRAINLPYYFNTILIEDVNVINNTATAEIAIGVGTNTETNDYPIGFAIIRNCKVRFIGEGKSHAYLIGSGANNSEISGCFGSGGDFQCVVKGDGNVVFDNIFVGANCLYLKGGARAKIYNNTCYATSGYAFRQYTDGSSESNFATVENNIFYATGADVYCYSNTHNDPFDSLYNFNCYYATGGAAVSNLGGAAATLAALQTQWATYTFLFTNNDANSISADPQFVNATTDFRLKTTSPCLNAGKPTLGTGKTTIGAWQPNAVTTVSQRSRYQFEDIYD